MQLFYKSKNLGLRGSVKQGFNMANRKHYVDTGDNAHPASEIKKILKHFISNNYSAISTYYSNKEKEIFLTTTDIYTLFLICFDSLKYYNETYYN